MYYELLMDFREARKPPDQLFVPYNITIEILYTLTSCMYVYT